MPKLTDTQLVMLSAAAQRADGAVETPENSKGTARKEGCSEALARRPCRGGLGRARASGVAPR